LPVRKQQQQHFLMKYKVKPSLSNKKNLIALHLFYDQKQKKCFSQNMALCLNCKTKNHQKNEKKI